MRLLRWTIFVAGATLLGVYIWKKRPKETAVSLTFKTTEPRVEDEVLIDEPKTPRADVEINDVKTPRNDFTSVVGYDDADDDMVFTPDVEGDKPEPTESDIEKQFEKDYERDLRLITEYLKTDAVFESAMAAALNTKDWRNVPESKAFAVMVNRILKSIVPVPEK